VTEVLRALFKVIDEARESADSAEKVTV